jgi:major membrane immunogen (membrane-anchored lipoprotein)
VRVLILFKPDLTMKIKAILLAVLILPTSISMSAQDSVKTNSFSILKDGSYTGYSRSIYTAEPYWGIVRFSVMDGKMTDISFMIRDSSLHETFNNAYASHFAGNEEYIQQTKNDWNGVKTYPARLRKKQDINKVDVISGATWSYNIFRDSFKEALKHSEKQE